MDVHVVYAIGDIYAVTFQSWKRIVFKILSLFAILVGALIGLFSLMDGSSVVEQVQSFPWKFYSGLIASLLLFVFLVAPAISYLRARRRGLLGPHQISVLDDGIKVESPQGESLLYWSAITRLVATSKRLFLFVSPVNALIVPRRAFANQDDFDDSIVQARHRWKASTEE